MFTIINRETGERLIAAGSSEPYLQKDGKTAADYARYLTDIHGVNYQVRRAEGDPNWREREQYRFNIGEYKPVDWTPLHNQYPDWAPIADHFVHMSKDSPEHVAFTPDDEYGQYDRQLKMRIGSYLQRSYSDRFSTHFIANVVTQMIAKHEKCELRFAVTAEDIARVYTEGPTSCMSKRKEAYFLDVHPTEVYAGGDLALAYLEREKRITARALVWPDKKLYSRMYGDTVRFQPLLEAEGYSYESDWDFSGARIRKILKSRTSHTYVMPYIDGASMVTSLDKDFFVIGRGTEKGKIPRYGCQNTNGLAAAAHGFECADCVEWSTHGLTVHRDQYTSVRVCTDCANAYVSTHGGDYVHRDHVETIDEGGGPFYIAQWRVSYCTDLCERTGLRCLRNSMASVIQADGSVQQWGSRALDTAPRPLQCDVSNRYYAHDAVICFGGYVIAKAAITRQRRIRVKDLARYSRLKRMRRRDPLGFGDLQARLAEHLSQLTLNLEGGEAHV